MAKKTMSENFEFNGVFGKGMTTKQILKLARDYFKSQPSKSMAMRMKILRYCVLTHTPSPAMGADGNNYSMTFFWHAFLRLKLELLDSIDFHIYCQSQGYDPYVISDHKVWIGNQTDYEFYYTHEEMLSLDPIFTEENCEADYFSKFNSNGSVWRVQHLLGIDDNGKYYYPYTVSPVEHYKKVIESYKMANAMK